MAVSAVEDGSGTLVLEPINTALLDLTRPAFERLIRQTRDDFQDAEDRVGFRALLALEPLFGPSSHVEKIEFIIGSAESPIANGSVTRKTIRTVRERLKTKSEPTAHVVVGKLLEVDLARGSFQVYEADGRKSVINFDDDLIVDVKDALDRGVRVGVVHERGALDAVAIEVSDIAPGTRFWESRSLADIVKEQDVAPIDDPEALALSEADDVELADLVSFFAGSRRRDASQHG